MVDIFKGKSTIKVRAAGIRGPQASTWGRKQRIDKKSPLYGGLFCILSKKKGDLPPFAAGGSAFGLPVTHPELRNSIVAPSAGVSLSASAILRHLRDLRHVPVEPRYQAGSTPAFERATFIHYHGMCSPTAIDVGVSWKSLVWRTSVQSRFSFSRMTFDANAKGLRLLAGAPPRLRFHFSSRVLFSLLLFASSLLAQSKSMYITKHYLNIPVARAGEMHVYQIQVDGIQKREFPVQLAELESTEI